MSVGGDALGVFERVAREALPVIGYRLFTVTAFDAATMHVQRIYSSNPSAYPVGGRKPKRDTEFARHILIEGKPLICEGDAAIMRIFEDHATILGLGLHAAINVPVVADDERVVGVLNFLFSANLITPDCVQAACGFAKMAEMITALSAVDRT